MSRLRNLHLRFVLPLFAGVTVAVVLWYLLPPAPRATLPAAEDGSISQLFFAPDGSAVAVIYGNRQGPGGVYLWEVGINTTHHLMYWGIRQLESLAFSRDGKTVAIRWHDRTIHEFERATGRQLAEYYREEWDDWNPHLPIVYASDGDLILYGPYPDSAKLWDVKSGREVRRLANFDALQGVVNQASAREACVVSISDNRHSVWDLPTGNMLYKFVLDTDQRLISGFDLSADGKRLVVFLPSLTQVACKVFQAGSADTFEARLPHSFISQSFEGRLLAVSVTNHLISPPAFLAWFYRLLSSGRATEEVQVFDLHTGRALASFGRANRAKFSPDGKLLAVATEDGAVHLYDVPFAAPWRRILGWSAAAFAGTYLLIAAGRRLRQKAPLVLQGPVA